jgi:hypothetical protein
MHTQEHTTSAKIISPAEMLSPTATSMRQPTAADVCGRCACRFAAVFGAKAPPTKAGFYGAPQIAFMQLGAKPKVRLCASCTQALAYRR